VGQFERVKLTHYHPAHLLDNGVGLQVASGALFLLRIRIVKTRRSCALVLVGLIIAIPMPEPVLRAQAAGGGDGCSPNRPDDLYTHQWDGWINGYPNVGGVWGQIRNYSPWVTDGFSSAWVMLENGGDGRDHHAQTVSTHFR